MFCVFQKINVSTLPVCCTLNKVLALGHIQNLNGPHVLHSWSSWTQSNQNQKANARYFQNFFCQKLIFSRNFLRNFQLGCFKNNRYSISSEIFVYRKILRFRRPSVYLKNSIIQNSSTIC